MLWQRAPMEDSAPLYDTHGEATAEGRPTRRLPRLASALAMPPRHRRRPAVALRVRRPRLAAAPRRLRRPQHRRPQRLYHPRRRRRRRHRFQQAARMTTPQAVAAFHRRRRSAPSTARRLRPVDPRFPRQAPAATIPPRCWVPALGCPRAAGRRCWFAPCRMRHRCRYPWPTCRRPCDGRSLPSPRGVAVRVPRAGPSSAPPRRSSRARRPRRRRFSAAAAARPAGWRCAQWPQRSTAPRGRGAARASPPARAPSPAPLRAAGRCSRAAS
mmetsp:Transcript_53878/g.165782  ORF Transcript_53878/g.165782 Transcript_53878/m.165782 type:complete len:270 (+) Transcript_53878:37-846(+)